MSTNKTSMNGGKKSNRALTEKVSTKMSLGGGSKKYNTKFT